MTEPIFDDEKFYKYMFKYAQEIKKQSFDKRQLLHILTVITSLHGHLARTRRNKELTDANLLFESVLEINLAIEMAYSNYRKENKNLLDKILGFTLSKIPQIDINKFTKP